jgi:fatty acid desaturase
VHRAVAGECELRQVLGSVDVTTDSAVGDFLWGYLNYQVEHHLFPSMPRPSLKRAGEIVKEYCASRNILYTEVGLLTSYKIVIKHLNEVGLGADGDPFDCPAAGRTGYAG